MKCPNCDEENFPGSSFCSNCGAPLTDEESDRNQADALHMAETVVGAVVPHFLVFMTADKKIKTQAITDKLRIGRESDNEIVLQDPRISRHHAVITRKDEGFELEDLASANGVLVNGVRITKPQLLAEGDRLKLGDSELVFTQSPEASGPSEASEPTISMRDETPVRAQPVPAAAQRTTGTPPPPPPPSPVAASAAQPDALNDKTSPRQRPAIAAGQKKGDSTTKWVAMSCGIIIVLLLILACLLLIMPKIIAVQ